MVVICGTALLPYIAAIKFSLSDVLNSNFQLRQREPLTVQYRGKVGGGMVGDGGWGGGDTPSIHVSCHS